MTPALWSGLAGLGGVLLLVVVLAVFLGRHRTAQHPEPVGEAVPVEDLPVVHEDDVTVHDELLDDHRRERR